MSTRWVAASGGVRLAVDTWEGRLPGFLLVHGLASNARLWDGVAAGLAALGHAVAAVDLRGHGRSDKPDGGYDFGTVSDDLVAVVGALQEESAGAGGSAGAEARGGAGSAQAAGGEPPWARPVVAGQSWGANVVLELAWREPALTRGVVCVDGGTSDLAERFPTWEACAGALSPPRLAGMPAADFEASVRARHPGWPEAGIRGTLANVEVLAGGTVRPWLSFEHHMLVLHALYCHRPSQRFAGMRVPVLLVPADNGDERWTAAKRAGVEAALAAIPRARARWFSPADHDVHAQHPDALAELLHGCVEDGFFA